MHGFGVELERFEDPVGVYVNRISFYRLVAGNGAGNINIEIDVSGATSAATFKC